MTEKEASPEQAAAPDDRAERGKRLLIYGMFSVVVVTLVAVFLSLWLILAPLNAVDVVIRTTLIVGVISVIACVVVWFIYTKAILKE
jgi:hypothetical protein